MIKVEAMSINVSDSSDDKDVSIFSFVIIKVNYYIEWYPGNYVEGKILAKKNKKNWSCS